MFTVAFMMKGICIGLPLACVIQAIMERQPKPTAAEIQAAKRAAQAAKEKDLQFRQRWFLACTAFVAVGQVYFHIANL